MPADVVKVGNRYELLRPNLNLPFTTNLPENLPDKSLQLLWARTGERISEAKGWLPESEWERYLRGQAPEQVVTSGKLFIFEPRFGIAIDANKGTTQEAMLYQARFVRLKEGAALWAEVDGVSLNEGGFLRFGGEGRAAIFQALSQQESLRPLSQFNFASNSNRFKVVLDDVILKQVTRSRWVKGG
jgi:CRISPR type III-B/RAMP module-associated protein Cmr3